jgi:hypothetical protein
VAGFHNFGTGCGSKLRRKRSGGKPEPEDSVARTALLRAGTGIMRKKSDGKWFGRPSFVALACGGSIETCPQQVQCEAIGSFFAQPRSKRLVNLSFAV